MEFSDSELSFSDSELNFSDSELNLANIETNGPHRTVPTFVSAHTFCASRKAWFTRHARASVEIDTINYD